MIEAAIRPAAVAGSFYPGSTTLLAEAVDACLRGATCVPAGPSPKLLLAPHAGFIYSGPIAGSAYA